MSRISFFVSFSNLIIHNVRTYMITPQKRYLYIAIGIYLSTHNITIGNINIEIQSSIITMHFPHCINWNMWRVISAAWISLYCIFLFFSKRCQALKKKPSSIFIPREGLLIYVRIPSGSFVDTLLELFLSTKILFSLRDQIKKNDFLQL